MNTSTLSGRCQLSKFSARAQVASESEEIVRRGGLLSILIRLIITSVTYAEPEGEAQQRRNRKRESPETTNKLT